MARILGQNRAQSLLHSDLKSDRIAESYLFSGPRGVGKKRAALEFAKAINCENRNGPVSMEKQEFFGGLDDPFASQRNDISFLGACEKCPSCQKIESANYPDLFILDFNSQAELLELDSSEKSRQKDYRIASIRILLQRSHLTPLEARKKIFIIDGAEHLNAESANALLKALEESSRQAVWILLTSAADRLLMTLRSRCRKVPFAPLDSKAVRDILREILDNKSQSPAKKKKDRKDANEINLEEVSELSEGSLEIAAILLSEESQELNRIAGDFLKELKKEPGEGSAADVLRISAAIISDKKGGAKMRAEEFLKILSLKLSARLKKDPTGILADQIDRVLRAQEDLKRNIAPQLIIDSLLLNF